MQTYHFMYLLAAATGIVSAGLAGSLWAAAAGEYPRPGMLAKADAAMPLKVLFLVASAPAQFLRIGIWYLDFNPLVALCLIATGLGWSFLQGVFILTTFFGYG
jgi:hypothetical protein